MPCRFCPRLRVYQPWMVFPMVRRFVNRYRSWVGGLHGAQLILLLPTLLLAGTLALVGALGYTTDMNDAARSAVTTAEAEHAVRLENAPEMDEWDKALLRRKKADRWDALFNSGVSQDEATRKVESEFASQPPRTEVESKVEEATRQALRAVDLAKSAEKRTASIATWLFRSGAVACAFAWLTAYLSLWWWSGARAKPRGPQ